MSRIAVYAVLGLWGLWVGCAWAAPLHSERYKDELTEANFLILPRPNYQGSYWLIDQATNDIVGYAPWDALKRRWTLFNLRGEYQGFMQATIGDRNPPDYRQYLWYGKDNQYKGVFIAQLGGRPQTPDLPHGELGGSLNFYPKGNIPLAPPNYEIETDPQKLFPEGIEVEPVPVLPGRS